MSEPPTETALMWLFRGFSFYKTAALLNIIGIVLMLSWVPNQR